MDLGLFWIICITIYVSSANATNKRWQDKDIRDMTDADLERLSDQWQENDDPLEPDELPEHLRPSPQIDLSKIDTTNPDNLLKMTKRGKTLMMFINMNQDIPEDKADSLMQIWHTSLRNNHIIAERYPLESKRSIFLFKDGSQAIDAKEYLLDQPELSHIVVDGQTYHGKHKKGAKPENKSKDDRKKLEL